METLRKRFIELEQKLYEAQLREIDSYLEEEGTITPLSLWTGIGIALVLFVVMVWLF